MKSIRETLRHVKNKTLEKVATNEDVNGDNYVWLVAIAFLSAVVVPFAVDRWKKRRKTSTQRSDKVPLEKGK